MYELPFALLQSIPSISPYNMHLIIILHIFSDEYRRVYYIVSDELFLPFYIFQKIHYKKVIAITKNLLCNGYLYDFTNILEN